MAGMMDRVRGRAASLYADRGSSTPAGQLSMRDMSISLDEWASYFSFGGLTYPLIQTTLGSVDKERIVGNAIAAFEGVSSVFALIQARVQVFAQVRFQYTRFTGSQPGDLFGTDDLRILERPWPNGSTAKLLAKMEIDNSIGGNGYIVRPRKDRLARLRPDLVTIALGSEYDMESPADAPDVEVAGYAYFPRSGRPEWFWPWEVAHYAPLPDPNFQFLGLSWMTPCLREVQSDALTTEHKYRFFANAATPNLAIKFDPSIGLEQVKAFKALVENDHKGAFNAYRTLYLGGGADPVPIGTNLQQLDFAVTQGHGEARLAAAAGVPASWVGFSEGLQGSSLNAGNFNAQRRRLMDGPQPLDAPVLSPAGWTTMGDLAVGAQVIGSDGQPHAVLDVYEQPVQDIYRVTFTDGSDVECSLGHTWTVREAGHKDRPWRPLPLSRLLDAGLRTGKGHPRWAVPLPEPVEYEPGPALPVDPYLLGLLLGDGTLTGSVRLAAGRDDADETERLIGPLLPAGVSIRRDDRPDASVLYLIGQRPGVWAPGQHRSIMAAALAGIGLRDVSLLDKFIPASYLRGCVKDRVALLQGLIDSDGCVTKEAQVRFANSAPQLIADVIELVRSLGGFARLRRCARGDTEVLVSRLPEWIVPCRLLRKQERYRTGRYGRIKTIDRVELVRSAPTRCILVDTPDHLYVAAGFTVTHNTMNHLWTEAAQSLEAICPPPDSHSNLWFDARIPSMREDASDIAEIQAQQAQTISALVMQGYEPNSVVKAVVRNDMSLLKHTGNLSVQLHPNGQPLPSAGNGAKPKALAGAASGNGASQGSASS